MRWVTAISSSKSGRFKFQQTNVLSATRSSNWSELDWSGPRTKKPQKLLLKLKQQFFFCECFRSKTFLRLQQPWKDCCCFYFCYKFFACSECCTAFLSGGRGSGRKLVAAEFEQNTSSMLPQKLEFFSNLNRSRNTWDTKFSRRHLSLQNFFAWTDFDLISMVPSDHVTPITLHSFLSHCKPD